MNLDKRVTIEKLGEAQDAAGQLKDTWTKHSEVWASIRPVSGRKFFAASGPRAEVTHEIILRHGPTIEPRDRITHAGRVFEVIAPLNVADQNRYMNLLSKENANSGS